MNRKIGTLWALVGLLSSLSYAQSWRGAEAVALQVNDAKGRAIEGARVVFTFQGIPGELGPDIVATDSKGQAVVAELAAGPWQVEVRHPDYLSFIAMIDVRRDKKPLISASFLEAGGRSLNPVKVKVSKGDERQVSPVLEARAPAEPSEPAAPIAQEQESPPVQVAEAPAPIPEPEPEVATPAPVTVEAASESVEEAQVELEPALASPDPEPTPTAEPETVEATPAAEGAALAAGAAAAASRTPETDAGSAPKAEPEVEAPPVERPANLPQPEVEPTPTEIPTPDPEETPEADDLIEEIAPVEQPPVGVEPMLEADAESVEATPPTVPTATAPTPPPVAVSALAAPPDAGTVVASHRDGSCPNCESAEWVLQVSAPVPAMDPGSAGRCDAGVLEAAQPAMQELASSIQLELQGFIGPIANGTEQAAIRHAEPDLIAPFQGPLAAFVGGTSPCQIVGLVLPKEVRFSRVNYAASDLEGSGVCTPGQVCSIGDAAWLDSARVERGPSATVVYGLFENRSGERARRAFLIAYYRPPSARWQPRLPAAD